jgi:hypothetical protein
MEIVGEQYSFSAKGFGKKANPAGLSSSTDLHYKANVRTLRTSTLNRPPVIGVFFTFSVSVSALVLPVLHDLRFRLSAANRALPENRLVCSG